MKCKKAMLFVVVFFICIGIFDLHRVSASEFRRNYFDGETAYVDMDGDGKTESVYIKKNMSTYYNDEVINSWEIIINGKSYGKKYLSKPLRDGTYVNAYTFEFIDIYDKDKYIELGVKFFHEVDLTYEEDTVVEHYYEVYRYKSRKCELVFKDEWIGSVHGSKKKNHVLVEEYNYCDLGLLYFDVDYKIKDKELTKAKNKERVYNICGSYYYFEANKSITMYKKNNLKQKAGVIKKGETFKVYKVRLSKSGNIVAAYVKIDKNRKGWIDVCTGCSEYGDDALVTWTYGAG